MRAAIVAATAAAALVATPRTADAKCGGGGGSSGGGSSSSGGGGSCSSSSSSSTACVDDTDIVGRRRCKRFAAWDVTRFPRLQIALGSSMHAFPTGDLSFSGTANHEDTIRYRIAPEQMPDGGRAVGGALDLRVTWLTGDHVYVGIEGSIGAASVFDDRVMSGPAGLTLDPGNALYLAGGALVGAQVPMGAYTLRAEALLGGRALGVTVTTSHDDCVADSVAWNGHTVVQPRVAAQKWLSPWATAGVWLGSDLGRDGAMSGGVFIQGHVRSFDATRSRR